METKYNEEKDDRDQGRKKSGSQFKQVKGSSQLVSSRSSSRLVPTQIVQSHTTGGQRRKQSREMVTGSSVFYSTRDPPRAGPQVYSFPVCGICGRRHGGECQYRIGACLRCGQLDHFVKDCPVRRETHIEPTVLQPTVKQDRPEGSGVRNRGRSQRQEQSIRQASTGRGLVRVFSINP